MFVIFYFLELLKLKQAWCIYLCIHLMKGWVVNLVTFEARNTNEKTLKHSFKLEFQSSYLLHGRLHPIWKEDMEDLAENDQKEQLAFYGLFAFLHEPLLGWKPSQSFCPQKFLLPSIEDTTLQQIRKHHRTQFLLQNKTFFTNLISKLIISDVSPG